MSLILGYKVLNQVVVIVCMAPWAFVGFENISNSAEEFTFDKRKSFRALTAAIITVTLLYIFVIILSVTAYPSGYDSWFAYLSDLGNLQGIEALPPFYAAQHYLGAAGVTILMLALLSLVLTSLIGNTVATSRLFFALARDRILSSRFTHLSARNIPVAAIALVMIISIPFPFLGRTAIGWIVDVTTIGAVIAFGFASGATYKMARQNGDKLEMATGVLGIAIMIAFGLMQMLPTLFDVTSMASESYFLFTAWAILGFVFFRYTLRRDTEGRFGTSVVVWVVLLTLVLFSSMAWMGEVDKEATSSAIIEVQEFYDAEGAAGDKAAEETFIDKKLNDIQAAKTRNTLFTTVLFGLAIVIMLSNFNYMRKREEERRKELGAARAAARIDPLTGVKNKKAFDEWTEKLDDRIATEGPIDFAVVVCDLNDLKSVNDTKGHQEGDLYIRESCIIVCKLFKHSPVFRIGGDEFTVILEGSDYESRNEIMDAFDATIEENLETGGAVIAAGMSEFEPNEDGSCLDVFRRADSLMYERKHELKEMGAVTRS